LAGRRHAANAACAAVLAVEVMGMAFMWAVVPFAWIWVGERIGDASGSLALAGGGAFLGFVGTVVVTASALTRIDNFWIELRRRAGYQQAKGALTQIVVVSATLGILVFWVWYYLLSTAFVLPFMPSQG
jgi:hypothetical protein